MTTPRPIEHDALVLGTGETGLTAAADAPAGGADVGLCEKTDAVGGTTAISAGVVWLPVHGRGGRPLRPVVRTRWRSVGAVERTVRHDLTADSSRGVLLPAQC